MAQEQILTGYVFTSMYLMHGSALCTILHLHIYTGGMLKAWSMLTNSIDFIDQLIMYVLNIYMFHALELL